MDSLFADKINSKINKTTSVILMTIVFVLVVTALSWQSDDAYHGYIMAKNLVDGHGFVYNIGERVNASTCPLFTLVIAAGYFFCRYMFPVSLGICILFSGLAAYLLFKYFCKNTVQIMASFLTLVVSFSFISYSSSGLENSLLYFLAAIFLKIYFDRERYDSRSMLVMAFLISLIAMTRMDAVLMFIPMILFVYLGRRDNVSFPKAVLLGFIGLLPFILWECFSVFYYGFPFPNTFYAKLGAGIPQNEYWIRGCQYFATTLCYDPIVTLVPVFSIISLLFTRNNTLRMCSLGVTAYLIYVFYIGGDFMVGRHFTVIFFISLISLLWAFNNSCFKSAFNKNLFKMWLIVFAAGILAITALRPLTKSMLYPNGPIADERDLFFYYSSLINNADSYIEDGQLLIWDIHPSAEERIQQMEDQGISSGMTAYATGVCVYHHYDMYLSDVYGLGDPLLSKLPAVREPDWRIGHMYREGPRGYPETLTSGENVIENESLREYYDVITLITRGPLFSEERLRAIVDMNLGRYDHLVQEYVDTLDESNRQPV